MATLPSLTNVSFLAFISATVTTVFSAIVGTVTGSSAPGFKADTALANADNAPPLSAAPTAPVILPPNAFKEEAILPAIPPNALIAEDAAPLTTLDNDERPPTKLLTPAAKLVPTADAAEVIEDSAELAIPTN